MALNQQISAALQDAESRILAAIQGGGSEGWISIEDDDGNPNVPTTERDVLVFLCGDLRITDKRPDDAGHGLRIGYYDHDKQAFRVHGSIDRYVTHWRECPESPDTGASKHGQ